MPNKPSKNRNDSFTLRLSPEEKARLEYIRQWTPYSSVSELVRAILLPVVSDLERLHSAHRGEYTTEQAAERYRKLLDYLSLEPFTLFPVEDERKSE